LRPPLFESGTLPFGTPLQSRRGGKSEIQYQNPKRNTKNNKKQTVRATAFLYHF